MATTTTKTPDPPPPANRRGGPYCKLSRDVLARRDLTASAKIVHAYLRDCANAEGHAWPAVATIAEDCGLGRRTVSVALGSLAAAGLIEPVGDKNAHQYHIVSPRDFVDTPNNPRKICATTETPNPENPEQTAQNLRGEKPDNPNKPRRFCAGTPPTTGISRAESARGAQNLRGAAQNLRGASMEEKQTQLTKQTKTTTASEAFEKFWLAYPKRKGKGPAAKAFAKIMRSANPPSLAVILAAVEKQSRTHEWRKQAGQFIPYPATWLNGQRWEDETDVNFTGENENEWDNAF